MRMCGIRNKDINFLIFLFYFKSVKFKNDKQLKKVYKKYAELKVHAKLLRQQLHERNNIISIQTQQIANDKENNF